MKITFRNFGIVEEAEIDLKPLAIEGRACLEMKGQGERICDYLYYFTKSSEKHEIVCLLELKGSDLQHASEQVKRTHQRLEILLTAHKFQQRITWRVCICLRGHAPSTSQRIHDELKRKYGKNNVEIRHGASRHDIGPLLRRDVK